MPQGNCVPPGGNKPGVATMWSTFDQDHCQDYGGTWVDAPPGAGIGPAPGGGHSGCLIVSAATGSAQSDEVIKLRQLRGRVARVSELTAQLIEAVLHEYYTFSPAIAAELESDATARDVVLCMAVRPLLAWYTLAGTLCFGLGDNQSISEGVKQFKATMPAFAGGLGASAIESIRSAGEVPASVRQLLPVSSVKLEKIPQLPFATWAIIDPIIRAWKSASDQVDIIDEVSRWLADAPLHLLPGTRMPQQLDSELSTLATWLSFRPRARRELGVRLAEAWPETTSALRRHGFIEEDDSHERPD